MRFEIRSGGIAAIAIGLALLSGAVFFLGMFAGYDIGRESQVTAAQVATVYPVESPPTAEQSNAAVASAATPAAAAAAAVSTASSAAANPADEPDDSGKGIEEKNIGSETASKPEKVAQAPTATPSPSAGSESEAPNSNPGEENSASAEHEASHPGRHRPYNIQIRAAMDLNGGNAMMKRLGELGYQSHLVPTQIAGQTWYRVEVGPYSSQEEAAAAEAELRQKYNSAYGGPRPAAQAGGPAAQPQSSPQSTAQRSN
jgi:septal ring-binding cell division protein DamX